ncbi:MAG: proteasome subunit alpha [Proteobacteria bacterium]|nr:proteasome subunit alpha [Pseudomonadota bacterium]
MPFYVSPEQVMADKAEYARKGIARGKSIIALEYDRGVLLIAENATALYKLGEIYDRIAFAGVGKFSEFDQLRKVGVRYADTKGYAYSRDDVRGKALANAYSQVVGDVFTNQMKPLEVEIIVVEVGDDNLAGHERNSIYRVQFDGFISDHNGFCVIGGNVDDVQGVLQADYGDAMPLGETVRLGRKALERGTNGGSGLAATSIEACILNRDVPGRKFRRLSAEEIQGMLDG